MTTVHETGWREEFGINEKRSEHFFGSKDDLIAAGVSVPQCMCCAARSTC